MVQVKRQFIDGRYGQIHLRKSCPVKTGKRPLICVHMFPQSGRGFDTFIRHAGGDREIVALDLPAYGESDAPTGPISIEDYAASVWNVIDSLRLAAGGAVDIFGIHAGAKIAVEVVHQRPAQINRIVLSSAAVMYEDEVKRLKSVFSAIPLDEEGTRFQHFWRMLVADRKPEMTLEMCAVGLAEMMRAGDHYTWGPNAIFDYNPKFADILKTIGHPVAVLNPGDELYDYTPRCLDFLSDSELFNLPDWTHGYLDAHVVEASRLITNWLDKPSTESAVLKQQAIA